MKQTPLSIRHVMIAALSKVALWLQCPAGVQWIIDCNGFTDATLDAVSSTHWLR